MALPANDDFANRELSIDELAAIAGGRGFPLPEPHLPPHWPRPIPRPFWAGTVGSVISAELF